MTVNVSSASITNMSAYGKREQGAADFPVDNGKLAGIGAHSLDYCVNRCTETPTEAGSPILIPILSVDQLGTGTWGENLRDALWAALLELDF